MMHEGEQEEQSTSGRHEEEEEEEEESKESAKDFTGGAARAERHVYFISCVAVLNQVSFGYDVGAVSQSLEGMKRTFEMSTLQEGAITSALNFFAATGALIVSGFLIDRYGRKSALKVAAALLFVGGVIVAVAQTFDQLLLGRFLQGLGVGASWSSAGIYITEVAPDELRGRLGALVDISINFGIILGYIVAFGMSEATKGEMAWRVSMGLSAVPPILFMLASPWLPESPPWLAKHRRRQTAYEEPGREPEEEEEEEADWIESLSAGPSRYASLISIAQQLTGTEAILYFAPSILPSGAEKAAFFGNLGIGGAKFLGELLAGGLADSKLGRRNLTVYSSASVTVGLVALGGFILTDASTVAFILALAWIMLSFSLGPGPFTTVFANEIVSTRHRAKSSAAACAWNRLTSAFVALTFLPMARAMGPGAVFLTYAVLSTLCTILYACTLPDTVGLSLDEIDHPTAPSPPAQESPPAPLSKQPKKKKKKKKHGDEEAHFLHQDDDDSAQIARPDTTSTDLC